MNLVKINNAFNIDSFNGQHVWIWATHLVGGKCEKVFDENRNFFRKFEKRCYYDIEQAIFKPSFIRLLCYETT